MATPRKGPAASTRSTTASRRSTESAVTGGRATAKGEAELMALVHGLAQAASDHGLSELIVETPDATFTLRRGPIVAAGALHAAPVTTVMHAPAAVANAPATAAGPAPAPAAAPDNAHVVTSPFVGTFYRRPSPDAAEYVRQGDRVKKNQVLCIIEAMKLMNEIEADLDGTLVAVLVQDGQPVEYGQPLFKISPA